MRRSVHSSTWHNCSRCSKKTDLSTMTRQRGVLVCSRESCLDERLIGERDLAVSRAIEATSNSKELQPHPVLLEAGINTDEDIFF